jgi:hypothetical protein
MRGTVYPVDRQSCRRSSAAQAGRRKMSLRTAPAAARPPASLCSAFSVFLHPLFYGISWSVGRRVESEGHGEAGTDWRRAGPGAARGRLWEGTPAIPYDFHPFHLFRPLRSVRGRGRVSEAWTVRVRGRRGRHGTEFRDVDRHGCGRSSAGVRALCALLRRRCTPAALRSGARAGVAFLTACAYMLLSEAPCSVNRPQRPRLRFVIPKSSLFTRVGRTRCVSARHLGCARGAAR